MADSSHGEDLGRAAREVRQESRRLVAVAHEAVSRSKLARAAAKHPDPVARRELLLVVKAREVAQIDQAIDFYGRMATYWREHDNVVMANSLDALAVRARERRERAVAERDAWPAVVPRP